MDRVVVEPWGRSAPFSSSRRKRLLAGFITLVAALPLVGYVNERSRGADRTGFMRFAGGYYLYNLSGRALPDPSGTCRLEMTLPNGQVATASFGLKP